MAACRAGDVLVVNKLDRLARSLPDTRDIVAKLTAREGKLKNSPSAGRYTIPSIQSGRLLFNAVAMVGEFDSDLIKMRTREGMKVACAKGRPRGKQPKLSARQEAHLVALHAAGG